MLRVDHTEHACLKALVLFKAGKHFRIENRWANNSLLSRMQRTMRTNPRRTTPRSDSRHATRILLPKTGPAQRQIRKAFAHVAWGAVCV